MHRLTSFRPPLLPSIRPLLSKLRYSLSQPLGPGQNKLQPLAVLPRHFSTSSMAESKLTWADVVEKAGAKQFQVDLPQDGEVKEVVLIAGWWGAKLRHVLKYAAMIQETRPGAATISCVPSAMLSITTNYGAVAKKTKGVLTDVAEVSPGMDLWLYYFSNGGLMMHTRLMDSLGNNDHSKEVDLNLKGLMLDSCPAYWTPRSVSRALSNGKDNMVLYCLFSVLAPIMSLFGDKDSWWKSVLNSDLHVPELYLFSTADQVTIAEKIKELMATRKENGIDVSECVFDDSMHVLHYAKHKEEYTQAIVEFMKTNS